MQKQSGPEQQGRISSAHSNDSYGEDESALIHIGDKAVQIGALLDVVALAGNPPHAKQLLQLTQRTGGMVICSSECHDPLLLAQPQ